MQYKGGKVKSSKALLEHLKSVKASKKRLLFPKCKLNIVNVSASYILIGILRVHAARSITSESLREGERVHGGPVVGGVLRLRGLLVQVVHGAQGVHGVQGVAVHPVVLHGCGDTQTRWVIITV